jgi:elongation factor G
MLYQPDKIRNIAVVGHQGSGKTTLVESLAFKSGLIKVKGTVEGKNTLSDYLPDEKERQVSISSAIVPIFSGDYKLNLIDVPGNDDFIFETIGITRIVKGAILVIDAAKGVQQGTIKNFNLLKKRGVPIFIFVNKMDKENVDFNTLFEEIKTKLDAKKCVPFSYPIGRKENFDGFVNVVELKARKYNGVTCEDDVIYDDKKPIIFELHNRLCEAVATTNDEMLEKFFSGTPLTNDEIKAGLRQGVLAGELYPVLVGSATKDIGINTLLGMLIDYLPSPADLKAIPATDMNGKEVDVKTDPKALPALQFFKNAYNPYQGMVSYFKVQSGTIHAGDELFCPNNGRTYKVNSLFAPEGEKLTPISEVAAGDIAATNRLEDIRLSYTLSDKSNPIKFKEVNYPTPVYFNAIVPETKKDSDKLFPAVTRMMFQDPSIGLRKEETTGQILLGGLSKTHLSFILDKLRGPEYSIKFTTEPLRISYRETITTAGEAEGRYIKQSGGSGYYGVVTMRFEPADGVHFEETVFGGHVDKGYFPAVEKGFEDALVQGGLIKAPVINVKATLLDGKQHSVDSNEMAFKNAAMIAFKNAYPKLNPILLEPFDRVTVNVENDYLGNVLSDLTKRRGRILSTDEAAGGTLDVVAIVPEAEITEYANELKALSKGTAFYNAKFEDYEQVPKAISDIIIKAYGNNG